MRHESIPARTDLLEAMRQITLDERVGEVLVGLDERLDAREAVGLAGRVARHVCERTGHGTLVAAILPRTPSGAAGVLGCAISGRPCLMLNPADPPARLTAILKEARPGLVIAGAVLPELPRECRSTTLQQALAAGIGGSGFRHPAPHDPDLPALLFATSGSTGMPSIIAHSMRSIMLRVEETTRDLRLAAEDTVIVNSSPAMASGFCFLVASVLAGARLLALDIASVGATALLRAAARERITVLVLPPPLMRALANLRQARPAFESVRMLATGAAGLPSTQFAAWRPTLPRNCAVRHTYASTEAGIIAEWLVPPDVTLDEPLVPSGRPKPGLGLTLLDEFGVEVAPGEAGQAVVAGPGVALGEWRQGALVASRFPAAEGTPGSRVFRTGDVMRLGNDGLLRFVSRGDRQVKVNGVRVEPAEIEAILRSIGGVTEALVVPRRAGEDVVLDAFVAAPGSDFDTMRAELRSRLGTALPPAMRPGRLVVMDDLPTNQNGKPDLPLLLALAGRAG